MNSSIQSWIATVPLVGFLGALYVWKGGGASLFLFLLALSIAIVGAVIQLCGPRRVVVQRTWSPLSPYDGEEIEVTIHVQLVGGIPPLWVQIEDYFTDDEEESGKLLFTGFKRSYSGTYRLSELSRGVYREGITRVAWGDIFGWFKRCLFVEGKDKLIVQPLPLRIFSSDGFKGRYEEGIGELSTEAAGYLPIWGSRLRAYAPGDPLKIIHWKSSARRGELISRAPEEIYEPPSCLLLYTDEKSYLGKQEFGHDRQEMFEIAVSAAAAWLHRESEAAEEFYFRLWPGNYTFQLSGREGLYKGLEVLAQAQPATEPSVSFAHAGEPWSSRTVRGRRVTVITGCLTSSLVADLLQMAESGAGLELWCAADNAFDKASDKVLMTEGTSDVSDHLVELRGHGIHIVPLPNYACPERTLEIGGTEHVIA